MQSEGALWSGAILFLVLGGGSMWLVPGYWKGRYAEKLHNATAPLGGRMGRSVESMTSVAFFVVPYTGLMMIVFLLAGSRRDERGTLLSLVLDVLTVIMLGLIAVLFLVLLFNRPHVVIPPHLRKGHAGLLGSLFTKRSENSDVDRG